MSRVMQVSRTASSSATPPASKRKYASFSDAYLGSEHAENESDDAPHTKQARSASSSAAAAIVATDTATKPTNLTYVDPSQDASLFYGIRMLSTQFWAYVVQHDSVFQTPLVQYIRRQSKEFAKYTLRDIMFDIGQEWQLPDAAFKRVGKPKSSIEQCADDFDDLEWKCPRIRVVHPHPDPSMRVDPSLTISLFPGLDIEIHKRCDSEHYDARCVRIGVRVPIYVQGKPVATPLPDVVATHGPQLAALCEEMDLYQVEFM